MSKNYIFKEKDCINKILDLSKKDTTLFYFPDKDTYHIKKLILPESLRIIDSNSFRSTNIEEIVVNDIAVIDIAAFNRSNLKTIDLKRCNLTRLPMDCFSGSAIENITLPDNLSAIGFSVFEGCKNLKNINIPDSVEIIGESAFKNCKNLETIHLPKNLNAIERFTFQFCSKLKNLDIPENVRTIDAGAFEDCISLDKICLPKNLELINLSCFNGTSLSEIHYSGNKKDLIETLNDFCIKNNIVLKVDNLDYMINNLKGFSFKDINKVYKDNLER